MPNPLTGDFDVVTEFAIPAVDRVLAAMHRAERFPHAMTMRVRDYPSGTRPDVPVVVGSVDAFGDPTVDHTGIGNPVAFPGQVAATDPRFWWLDGVVNTDVVGADIPPLVPSHLQGRAQLQLAPPTIEVTGTTGSNITVKLPVRARYFPDAHTPPVAEFVRGELQITAPVGQVASPDPKNLRIVDVDIRGPQVSIGFSFPWSSPPLSAGDLAAVNQLIRNALKTSFLPSSIPLPDNVNFLQFKTLLGTPNAIAVLLNMVKVDPATGDPLPPGSPGNAASMNNVFLRPGDDFAIAAGKEFILGQLNFQLQNFHVWEYTVTLKSPTVELQNDRIVVTIEGHASSWLPDLGFTAKQAFRLNPAATTPGGPHDTAELAILGDISLQIHASSWVWFWYGWAVDKFKGLAKGRIRSERDASLKAQNPTVRDKLSTEKNLGDFLNSLLKPPQQDPGAPPLEELKPVLAYTAVNIQPSGIVLHGSVAVPDWPLAHVEFQQIPTNTSGPGGIVEPVFDEGPDYSALKAWIPGGRIEQYEWGYLGQTQPFIDVNKFVYLHPPPEFTIDGTASGVRLPGFTPFCLTVRGKRYSSSGPVVEQSVSATACGTTRFDLVQAVEATLGGASLMVALAEPGADGRVEVAGHAPARSNGAGGPVPNRIVHFADEKTAGHLEFLTEALRESGREDAPAAVLAVLTPGRLPKTRHVAGVIYAEDEAGAWERAFGVKAARRPVTLVAGPNGKVLWQHEGDLDSSTLAAALRKVLAPGRPVGLRLSGLSLRIGRRAPNFLFDLAPGRGLTLRKLEGHPVALIFWNSASKPSIEAVRDLQKPAARAAGRPPVVLAINDGEAPDIAKRVVAENGLSATLVTDPKRSISLAYGVSVWPTIVFLDASGLVRGIQYGRLAGEPAESPSRRKAAASK